MAENDLKIKISTTADIAGVQQADKALKLLGGTAATATADTQSLTTGMTSVGKASGNSGRSLLLFSQGVEDAQYGVKGILNNIPGLVIALGGTAGLAGALSIAAVGLSVLGDWFTKTDKKVGDSKGKIKSWADEARQVYQDLADLGKEDEERRAKGIVADTKSALDALKNAGAAETGAGKVDTAAAKAQNLLSLAQQRYDLLELEAVLAVSTGTKLLELTRQREESARKIYQTELETADIPRQAALTEAENKARLTRGAETITAGAAGQAITAAQAAKLAKEALEDEASQRIADRIDMIQQLADLKKELSRLARETAQAAGGNLAAAATPSEETLAKLKEQRTLGLKAADNDSRIQQLILQADAEKGNVATLADAARVASEAQKQASDAMLEAARTLENLKATNSIERDTDKGLKAIDAQTELRRTGKQVTDAARAAIDQIQSNSKAQGRDTSLIEKEALGGLQKIVTDTTDDAQQGGQLATILQSLANNLTGRDQVLLGGIENLITIAKSQATSYAAVMARVGEALELTTKAVGNQAAINAGFKAQIEGLKAAMSQSGSRK